MSAWSDIYQQVQDVVKNARGDTRFLRGHSDARWRLLPSLARSKSYHSHFERGLYFDFLKRGASLLSDDAEDWSGACGIQHHGLPTRLLDWSETFAIALFFALREGTND